MLINLSKPKRKNSNTNVVSQTLSTQEGLELLAEAIKHPIRRCAEFHFASRTPLVVDELAQCYIDENFENNILHIVDEFNKDLYIPSIELKSSGSLPLSAIKEDCSCIDDLQIKLAEDIQKQEESLVFGMLKKQARQVLHFPRSKHIYDLLPGFQASIGILENHILPDDCVVLFENVFASDKKWEEIVSSYHAQTNSDNKELFSMYSPRDILTNRQYGLTYGTGTMRGCNEMGHNELLFTASPDMLGIIYLINDLNVTCKIEDDCLITEIKEVVAARLLDPVLAVLLKLS